MTLDANTNKALAMIGGDLEQIAANIAESQHQVQQVQQTLPGFVSFTKFMQRGTEGPVSPWQYGRDDEERQIRPDSLWLIDFSTVEWGWSGHKKDDAGNMIKGQKPDQVLVAYHACPPAPPSDKPWVKDRTVKFRAMCLEEGADLEGALADERVEAKGDVIEVTIHQAMAEGFVELVNAVRERVQMVVRAKTAGNAKLLGELVAAMYPTIRFDFRLKVKVKTFINNKPILKLVGWGSPIVSFDAAPDNESDRGGDESETTETDDATSGEAIDVPPTAPAAQSKRRSRTK